MEIVHLFAIKTRKIYRYIFAQIWKKYCYHGFLIKIEHNMTVVIFKDKFRMTVAAGTEFDMLVTFSLLTQNTSIFSKIIILEYHF